MWMGARSAIATSKLYSRTRIELSFTVHSVAGKEVSLPQRRNQCAMAPSKSTNKKPALTHFLCLPLLTPTSTPQLHESLSRFKQSVTRPDRSETPASEGIEANASITTLKIPEEAFRPLGVLHLTLGVMSLRTEERKVAAKTLLESLDLLGLLAESERLDVSSSTGNIILNENSLSPPESDPPPTDFGGQASTCLQTLTRTITPPSLSRSRDSTAPLVVSLRGLQAFPKPQKATVLHCQPQDRTSRLYPFCLKLKQSFVDAGVIEPEGRPLVLHATIVNTVYAKKDRRNEERRMGSIEFDATDIMRMYNENGGIEAGEAKGEFVWANEILIDRVRICEMGAKLVENTMHGQEYTVFAEKMI